MDNEKKQRLIALRDSMKEYGYTDGVEELESIFPELAESEDERMINKLIAHFKWDGNTRFTKEECDEAIAYLEKQKEHQNNSDAPNESSWPGIISSSDKDSNLDEIAQDYVDGVKEYNSEPTWDLVHTAVCYGYHYREQKEQKPSDDFCKTNCKGYQETGKCFADGKCDAYVKEQKSAEWSDEDELHRNFIMESLEDQIRFQKKDAEGAYYTKQIRAAQNWLKSFRPQSQSTYKQIIHSIYNMLKGKDFFEIQPSHRVSLLNDIRVKCKIADECAEILDEPHWKPSEDQMKALYNFAYTNFFGDGDCDALRSLYDDLKKLM